MSRRRRFKKEKKKKKGVGRRELGGKVKCAQLDCCYVVVKNIRLRKPGICL